MEHGARRRSFPQFFIIFVLGSTHARDIHFSQKEKGARECNITSERPRTSSAEETAGEKKTIKKAKKLPEKEILLGSSCMKLIVRSKDGRFFMITLKMRSIMRYSELRLHYIPDFGTHIHISRN